MYIVFIFNTNHSRARSLTIFADHLCLAGLLQLDRQRLRGPRLDRVAAVGQLGRLPQGFGEGRRAPDRPYATHTPELAGQRSCVRQVRVRPSNATEQVRDGLAHLSSS